MPIFVLPSPLYRQKNCKSGELLRQNVIELAILTPMIGSCLLQQNNSSDSKPMSHDNNRIKRGFK